MPTPPISAVLITYNSARILPEVLKALDWCAEILLVDSGSTDRTLLLAEAAGCRILHRDFDGFGTQKGFAVGQARNDWVLVVDADELVTPELRLEIRQRLAQVEAGELDYKGFEVPISLVFMGRLMRYGQEYKMPHLRLFNKRFGSYNDKRVHEDVVLHGPVGRLKNHILHDSYGSLHDYFEKFNRYTTAGAHDLAVRKRKPSASRVIFRFPLTFLKVYILRLNFLNGYPGFVWSLFSAMYAVVKYAKLNELAGKPQVDTRQTVADH